MWAYIIRFLFRFVPMIHPERHHRAGKQFKVIAPSRTATTSRHSFLWLLILRSMQEWKSFYLILIYASPSLLHASNPAETKHVGRNSRAAGTSISSNAAMNPESSVPAGRGHWYYNLASRYQLHQTSLYPDNEDTGALRNIIRKVIVKCLCVPLPWCTSQSTISTRFFPILCVRAAMRCVDMQNPMPSPALREPESYEAKDESNVQERHRLRYSASCCKECDIIWIPW